MCSCLWSVFQHRSCQILIVTQHKSCQSVLYVYELFQTSIVENNVNLYKNDRLYQHLGMWQGVCLLMSLRAMKLAIITLGMIALVEQVKGQGQYRMHSLGPPGQDSRFNNWSIICPPPKVKLQKQSSYSGKQHVKQGWQKNPFVSYMTSADPARTQGLNIRTMKVSKHYCYNYSVSDYSL